MANITDQIETLRSRARKSAIVSLGRNRAVLAFDEHYAKDAPK